MSTLGKWMFASLVLGTITSTIVADDGSNDRMRVAQLMINAQRICPVSGKVLNSMEAPVKARVGEATVYLCCKGCLGKPLDKQHWSTMKANIADAQATCPIFKKPLGDHPVSVVVDHRLLFVCCKPCTKKVKADPVAAIRYVNHRLIEKYSDDK